MATALSLPILLCGIALLSSDAVNTIARLSTFNSLMSVTLVGLAAMRGLVAVSCASIVGLGVYAAYSLRITTKQIGLNLAIWLSSPTSEHSLLAVVFARVLDRLGFEGGMFYFKHPLQEELATIWAKIRR